MLVVVIESGYSREWEGNNVIVVKSDYNSLYDYLVSKVRNRNDIPTNEEVDLTEFGYCSNDNSYDENHWEDDEEGNCTSYKVISKLEDLLEE